MHNIFVNGLRRKQIKTEPMAHNEHEDPRQRAPNSWLGLRDLELGLAQVPAEQREVLLLVCVEEMSYEQVAAIIGVPVGTIMSRLHRARKRLRSWMAGEQRPHLRRVK